MTTLTLSGGDKLEAKLAEIASKVSRAAAVRVGFLEGATYPDGTSVATVAAIQNFGAPSAGIPARPFFSNMIADGSPEWGAQLAGLLERLDWNVVAALTHMGGMMANELRQALIDMDSPALSKVTLLLRERFSDHSEVTFADVQQARRDVAEGIEPTLSGTGAEPLVWTGHMLNSIDFEVEP